MMRNHGLLRAALAGAVLFLASCGQPDVTFTLTMSQELAAEVEKVEIRVLGSVWSCPTLRDRVDDVTQMALCADDRWDVDPPCIIASTEQPVSGVAQGVVQLFIPPGERQVFVTGLDATGERIAIGCVGPVEIRADGVTEVRVPLN